ncbi:hypothetical protein SNEBB_001689 [Seison nebaliae]|nr:hypothetical protein SNEBB_001689 [Seison nebaliae]
MLHIFERIWIQLVIILGKFYELFDQLIPKLNQDVFAGSLDRNIIPKSIRILDVSWSSDPKVNMKEEFKKKHIPKSQHFDLFATAKPCRLYPRPFPLATDFESYTKFQIGLNRDDHVVVYDRSEYGFQTASKAFWTFKVLFF